LALPGRTGAVDTPAATVERRGLAEPDASAASTNCVRDLLEAQVALARLGISPGSIDGLQGAQTRAALRAFQRREGLRPTGDLDVPTRARLTLSGPALGTDVVSTDDLTRLKPLGKTWLARSEQDRLEYDTALELVAERNRAHPRFLQRLNPGVNWTNLSAGTLLTVPAVGRPPTATKAAFVRIELGARVLQAFDERTNLLAHFPCSIAQRVDKRPVGELHVAVVAPGPNYRFDPAIFPESEEARQIGRKLMIPPGPNNPVGTVWLGLDRPGYGIPGTPRPEDVGRTESHGCFRLANWNAEHLLELAWIGMPVVVEP
jgi:lipoprotein-anchoring transpeptidase ErfK/SrfK